MGKSDEPTRKMSNLERLLEESRADIAKQETEPIQRLRQVSYDMCARLNALINPNWSSIRLYITTNDTIYPALVKSIVPSTQAGYVLVECNAIMYGKMILLVGAGHSFDLRIQT